jgi:hypothetical protein
MTFRVDLINLSLSRKILKKNTGFESKGITGTELYYDKQIIEVNESIERIGNMINDIV